MTVRPRIARLPNQSMARKPDFREVLAVWMSRKRRRIMNASPEKGTGRLSVRFGRGGWDLRFM